MNNIEKISNEPTPVAAMTSSQGTPSSNTPILPGFNDDDLDSLDDNETTTQCGACRCADASCDGCGVLQTIFACCVAAPLALFACCSC
ncbi:hypothetical protein RSOL_519910 [Rhizoctonia solani AG-3 Rhs1AP]|uniref:Uncharacterized protein n=2 Tax=Rhizoctonia solani AG-3 TaxID=1086053 RepID=A0A074S519_9AGAM|nr:hypothetical protein RSOL_519910 [Rhizoctonia solani AG-3 Rhs1AP]KEP54511.1 hypothetical protein V565_016620 [Rhizoctonia solani 123E]